MANRSWDELATGVDSMDAEHRLQVSLVSAVEELIRQGTDATLLERTLSQLTEFTRVHFSSEELMMRLHAYPQLELHAAAHAKLLEQVRSIKDRLDRDGPQDALGVVQELHGWLVNHIQSMDQAFALWCAKNGIAAR